MSYATCRGCDRAFTKYGYGAQSSVNPKLCADCAVREVSWHGYHAPGTKCLDEFMAQPRGGRTHWEGVA